METQDRMQPTSASESPATASEMVSSDHGQAQGGAMPPHSSLQSSLRLVSDDESALQAVLAAWQREQDRLANRAWRRPGGMARPAGL